MLLGESFAIFMFIINKLLLLHINFCVDTLVMSHVSALAAAELSMRHTQDKI